MALRPNINKHLKLGQKKVSCQGVRYNSKYFIVNDILSFDLVFTVMHNLTLKAPTPQNGYTQSNNLSAVANCRLILGLALKE